MCFKIEHTKININYHLDKKNTHFPKIGWMFPCYNCETVTSYFFTTKSYEVYMCRDCYRNLIKDKDYKKKYEKKCYLDYVKH